MGSPVSLRKQAACAKSVRDEHDAGMWDQTYHRKLTAELRPRHGDKADALAQAYVDFTNDRPPSGSSWPVIEAHQVHARARFNARVRQIHGDKS